MTRRQRTSALVALSLLTSAAMAHAECAWVLWVESHFTSLSSNSSDPSKWESVDGLATGQACKEARRAWITKHVPEPQRRDALASNMFLGPVDPDMKGAVQPMTLTCLPDTMDPRGPKAAGR